MINKKQSILSSSSIMKMRLRSFASLLTRSVFGLLVLFAMLVSSTTMVFPQTEWDRHPDNPVLDLGPAGSWDDERVAASGVILDDTKYHMWYSGYDGTK